MKWHGLDIVVDPTMPDNVIRLVQDGVVVAEHVIPEERKTLDVFVVEAGDDCDGYPCRACGDTMEIDQEATYEPDDLVGIPGALALVHAWCAVKNGYKLHWT